MVHGDTWVTFSITVEICYISVEFTPFSRYSD